ncbi:hypothetical protein GCM10023094_44820 [Rhodococcus olei]|uniref:DUF2269 family protein n=1 Tax=Rhodococcus olei TaxID=2161675 RepID=A0ABP8PGB7_9NOCA
MGIAALVLWILAAGGGSVLLATWIAKGGARQPTTSRLSPGLVFGHFALAGAGLIVWIIYLVTDTTALAWVAFAALVVVAVLGLTMFIRWIPSYRAGSATRPGSVKEPGTEAPPEKHFPVAVVAGHGVFAVATVVLVLLAALGVGS